MELPGGCPKARSEAPNDEQARSTSSSFLHDKNFLDLLFKEASDGKPQLQGREINSPLDAIDRHPRHAELIRQFLLRDRAFGAKHSQPIPDLQLVFLGQHVIFNMLSIKHIYLKVKYILLSLLFTRLTKFVQ